MRPLYEIVLESHGVVTDVNSWSKTIDYLCKYHKDKVDDTDHLSPWMSSVVLIQKNTLTAEKYYAAYRDDLSKLVNNKMDVYVEVDLEHADFDSREFKRTLQHEIQHAFDDFISRSKSLGYFYSDQYKTTTGFEYEETSPYNVLHTSTANCDDLFALFKWCTYFFEPTEVNAYAREFDDWLSAQTGIDLKRLVSDPNDAIGINPLTFINMLFFVQEHIDQYQEDADHVDWDYIKAALSARWVKQYLGKNITGEGKGYVLKVLDVLIKRAAKPVFVKYRKIIEYHIMNNHLDVTEYPSWWRKM